MPDRPVFDSTTGAISITPAMVSPATDYTITAYNSWNNSITIVNISATNVSGSMVANISYAQPNLKLAMSPIGDGRNDALAIDNIEHYPNNKLTLLNASGTKIFEITGCNNSSKVFNWHYNIDGKMQKAGTYYYVLDYRDGYTMKHKTGYFLIKY